MNLIFTILGVLWILVGMVSWAVIIYYVQTSQHIWEAERRLIKPDITDQQLLWETVFTHAVMSILCLVLAPIAAFIAYHRVRAGRNLPTIID